MSSSFLKRAALFSLFAMPVTWAQQSYFIPSAEVTAERNTNRELVTSSATAEESNAFKAALSARMGRATPRTQTELRPRAVFQEFPDREGVDPVEYFLDLRHDYRTIKGRFSLTGSYARQDTINAEFGDVTFDDGDPTTPPPVIDDASGIVFVGQTRQTYEVTPAFEYTISERMSLGGLIKYQSVRYDENLDSQRVGFDSPLAELNLIRKVGERTSLSFGPYASYFEVDEDDELQEVASVQTDTYGARLGLDHQWSERSSVTVAVRGERNDTTCECINPRIVGSSTDWGMEILGMRVNRVGSIRYGIGRFLTPSTLGSRRQSDQIQLQYDRPLSERLGFHTALRLSRDRPIGPDALENDRDRFRTELSLRRLITPTWFVTGGYRFAWQDISTASNSAENHTVFLSVGFKGRDPRRATR